MSEFLAAATPDQLLLCMAGPLMGAIFLAGFLFVAFRGRLRPKQPAEVNPGPALANFTPSPPVDTPAAPGPSAELDLNFDVLQRRDENDPAADFQADFSAAPETEATMMNLSQQPPEKRGLAARIGNRAAAAPAPPAQAAGDKTAPIPPATTSTGPTPADPPVELLRLLRDPHSGQLIVEIAGQRYTRLADISDKEIGQYILKLAAHLLGFTNGMIAGEAGVKSLPAPKLGPLPLPPAARETQPARPQAAALESVVTTPKTTPPVEAALLASLIQQPVKAPEPPQRRGFFGRPKPAQTEEPLLPPLNLAEQINRIVQARLLASPLAYTTKLEITSDLHGGIRINVNGTSYSGPDEIPNPEVRELIKESIRVWEKS